MEKSVSTQIVQIQKNVGTLEEEAQNIRVRNNGDLSNAVEFLQKIRSWKKRIEDIRIGLTKPLNDHIKNLNADFKFTSKPLDEMDVKVAKAITDYREKEAEKIRVKQEAEAEKQRLIFEKEQESKRKQLEKEREEMSKKEAREREKEIKQEEFVAVPTVIQNKEVGIGEATMKTRKTWDFEIEDETKIPRKYMKVDEVAIGKAVRGGGIREIKGIRIFSKESLI